MNGKLQFAVCAALTGLLAGPLDTAEAQAAESAPFNDGRYIIRVKSQAGAAPRATVPQDRTRLERGRRKAEGAGGLVVKDMEREGDVVALLTDEGARRLKDDPEVELVEPDYRRYPMAETKPYGIPMVQADNSLFTVTHANNPYAGTMVCIIDSGYQSAHEDLVDGSLSGTGDLVTGTQNGGTGNWNEDSCGHGTHVAGTIAAIGGNDTGVVGVNANGRLPLHIQKVFNGSSCAWTYTSTLVQALNNCVAAANSQGRKTIVSMSLGGSGSSTTENSAFQAAYDAGHLLVAAAGNAGNTAVSYPAGYASVISVAAVDANRAKASFSQANADVEIAAPGVDTLSTTPFAAVNLKVGSNTWNGVSVTGAAATTATGILVDGGSCAAAGAWTGRIVICTRGTTSFATMNTNVRAGGGVGMVVANNVAGTPGFTLGTGVTSPIPAIGITDVDAVAARANVNGTATLDNVIRVGNGYEYYSGTSMATPHVSGVAALIWSLLPERSNVQVRQALTGSAIDLGAAGRDTSFGFGLVQAKAAYDYLLNPPPLPILGTDMSTAAFGNQGLYVTSTSRIVTVTNSGTATANLAIALAGTNATMFSRISGAANNCGTTLAPGISCTIAIAFRPTSSGAKVATLNITPSVGAAKSVSLTGNGVAGSITLTPTSLAFGSVTSGNTSNPQPITVRNSATNGAAVSMATTTGGNAFTFTGTNANQFQLSHNCPAVLAANATCQVSVVFKPTSTGSKRASARVAPAGVTARTAALTGTGT